MAHSYTNMLLKHYPSVVIEKIYKQFRSDIHVFITRAKLSEYSKMIRCAIWSAFWGQLGKHETYKPVWSIKKENVD